MIVRCKTCGNSLRYDIALGRLCCAYCSNSYVPEEFEDEETDRFDAVTYTCQNCGAELITADDTEATAFCSFCGSASILTGRLNGIKKPDRIVPFKITKEKCREIYLKKAKSTFLVPAWLKDEECIDSFRAIYMPYWAMKLRFEGKIDKSYSQTYRNGDYIETSTQRFTTEPLSREIGSWAHDATQAFADDISEVIGFDKLDIEKESVPFHQGYLSGFYADMAEDTASSHKLKARSAAMTGLGKLIDKNNNKNNYYGISGTVVVAENKVVYMPVWFMSLKRGDYMIYAAVNGYNGKIIADFPVSTQKFLAGTALIFAALFAYISIKTVLRPEPAFWISFVLALIGLIICKWEHSRYETLLSEIGIPCNSGSGATALSIFGLIAAICLALTKRNAVIYSGVLVTALILVYNCIDAFRVHRKIAQRRPPHFNRKGADDRA